MTETRVIIDLDREATPDQMVTMQDGLEASIDHIVGDTIDAGGGYAGMLATVSALTVNVTTGRYYNGGKVYSYNTAGTFDMTGKLPLALKKIVLILAYGNEQDTNTQNVNFLVEAQSTPQAPVYAPQAVATTHERLAVVSAAYGQEAANPVAPDAGLALIIATIVLGPSSILSCTNNAANQVPVLTNVATRVSALETFEATVGPEISTLASQLAALANSSGAGSLQAAVTRAFLAIAELNAKEGIPSDSADSSMDYLLDGTNCDLTNALSNCKVMEGIRFADDAADTVVFNLFNPFDPNAVIKNGYLFPAYTRYMKRTTGPETAYVAANSYTYNPVAYTLQTVTQQRISYGTPFDICTNSDFWQSGTYDPITSIFTLPSGQTYLADFDPTAGVNELNDQNGSHVIVRLEQYWTDSVSETYWGAVVQAPQTINGYHLFETFLEGQDEWIDAVGVPLGALASSGDITLVIVKASNSALPDPTRTLATVTIPFANLAANAENVFSLANPILLEAGKRYGIGVITAQGHQVATTDGPNFPQGTFIQLAPSGFAAGDLTKHLCLNIYGCKFNNSAVSIQLQNLQLSGGMCGIQILGPTINPDSTAVTYEIQLAGVWVPLNASTVGQLNSGGALPPNVPIRVTLAGTPDMMPALNLSESRVTVNRPKTAYANVWPLAPRTPPVSSSNIGVIERYESFDPDFHTAAVKLLTGSGYITQVAPSSYSDKQIDDTTIERTYLFALGSAVASYKVLSSGTTTTALNTFLVSSIQDYVL